MTFIFLKKFPLSRPKFLMTFFLVIDQVFLIFPFLFLDFPYLYRVKCHIWPFLPKKNHYFRKEFLDDTFFYSVRTFALIRQHYFSKYWGGRMHGPSTPPQILGDRPPS